jgi:predicted MFS family arabinose efflux permease
LGNGAGPFIGGAVVEAATFRWVFWMIPIMTIPTSMVILFFLPLKHRSGDHLEKFMKIDYGGVLLNITSTLLVLIPLSGGGVTYAWASPFFIACTVTGAVVGVMFVLYEWKLVALPIMPLRLYRAPHCWALYLQTFLIGLAYFGNFFYLPIYFQSILRYSPLVSGALILPVVITTSFASITSGQYMNRVGRYSHCVLAGFALWTVGNGLTLLFDRNTGLGRLVVVLIVEGAGIGLTLQPTLVGIYANGLGEDRAVATGLRNFIRTIGGAFGLVISGVILSNTLCQNLTDPAFISDGLITQLTSSTYDLDKLGLTQSQQDRVLDIYMLGIHYIFAFYTACIGLSLCLTFWVGDTSLKAPKKEDVVDTGALDEEAPQAQVTLGQGIIQDGEEEACVGEPYVKSDDAR